jgi:hypothetical protein
MHAETWSLTPGSQLSRSNRAVSGLRWIGTMRAFVGYGGGCRSKCETLLTFRGATVIEKLDARLFERFRLNLDQRMRS